MVYSSVYSLERNFIDMMYFTCASLEGKERHRVFQIVLRESELFSPKFVIQPVILFFKPSFKIFLLFSKALRNQMPDMRTLYLRCNQFKLTWILEICYIKKCFVKLITFCKYQVLRWEKIKQKRVKLSNVGSQYPSSIKFVFKEVLPRHCCRNLIV